MNCPKCQAEIPLADVNVASDIALCRKCEESFSYAQVARDEAIPQVDLNHPPKGISLKRTPDGFELATSTRSAIAIFLVPFMCLWSGGSMGGIYGTQIAKGDFNLGMSLFGLPFLLGTLILGAITLMTIAGKVTVRRQGSNGQLFAGVGSIGLRKHFTWDQVKAIRRITKTSAKGHSYQQICLQLTTTDKPLSITSGSSTAGGRHASARMDYLLGALNQLHNEYLLTHPATAGLPSGSDMAGTLVPAPPGAKPPIAA